MRISVDDNTMVKKAIEMTSIAAQIERLGHGDLSQLEHVILVKDCRNAARTFAHFAGRELEDIPECVAILHLAS